MKYSGEHLFVYGTLLLPQIMLQVTRQRNLSLRASLHDYARYGIRGKTYPGVIHEEGASVSGQLYINITPVAWQRLDNYEDDFYQREYVAVETTAGVYYAWSYVVPNRYHKRLSRRDWSLDQFRQRHLQGFMQHIASTQHA